VSDPRIGAHPSSRWVVGDSAVDLTRSEAREVTRVRLAAEPRDVVVDLGRTAVVVVDMQNDFCADGGFLYRAGVDCGPARALIEPINALNEALRARGVPVIWLNWAVRGDRLNMPPSMPDLHRYYPGGQRGADAAVEAVIPGKGGWGAFEGSWGAELVDGLLVREGDLHVRKNRFSGFFQTELDSVLRGMDVRTLLFAGVAMDICVLATLQDAMFLGYDAVMLRDCVATNSPEFCVQAAGWQVTQLYGFMSSAAAVREGLASA
jgi:nicotinamidase-related amidase